jgi:hypothetical protein
MNYDHPRRWISIIVILISVVLHRAIKLSVENNSPHVDNIFLLIFTHEEGSECIMLNIQHGI